MPSIISLLLSFANPRLDMDRVTQTKQVTELVQNWEYLLQMALRHGVLPFLNAQISLRVQLDQLPELFVKQLRLAFHKDMVKSIHLTKEIFNVTEYLRAAHLKVIPFKGPVISFMAYEDITLRQPGDIDLLIKRQDLTVAEKVLGGCGYQRQAIYTVAQEKRFLQVDCQHVFYNAEKGITLDLHWEFVPNYWGIRLNTEELWARTQPLLVEDTWVEVFAPEDTLLILVLNAAKDLFNRLIRLYDIAGFIQRHPQLNWPELLARAQKHGLSRMLKVSLYLVDDLLGTPLPAHIVRYVKEDSAIAPLARQAQSWLIQQSPAQGNLRNMLKPALLMDSRWRCWQFYRRLALTPTLDDWELLELPPSLEFAYYFLRPLRLARKYLFS